MNYMLLMLAVAALIIYRIVRGFIEQEVTLRALLMLPILMAYLSYTRLQGDFAQFSPTLLILALAIGALVGLIPGYYRGRQMRMRLENTSGRIFAKPTLASSFIWLGLLIARIAAMSLSYFPFAHGNLLLAMVATGVSALFLVSISFEGFIIYQKATRLQGGLPQQFFNLGRR